jgi:hypothetical protein
MGAGYGETYKKWEAGKIYEAYYSIGHLYIMVNKESAYPFPKNENLYRFFLTEQEYRDLKIDIILGNGNINKLEG